MTPRSIGIPGATPVGIVRALAPLVERAGYRALWINDTPQGDSLAALAAAAEVTSTLGLASGVIPLDRRPPAEIAADIRAHGLPLDRVRVGIGSGGATRALALVESGIDALGALGVPVLVGALGPRMRALAARRGDGILFNWLPAGAAADATRELHAAAADRRVEGVLYARTILDAAVRPTLEREAARYVGVPSYAANFARLGIDPVATAIDLSRPGALEEYGAVDELVLRAVTPTGSLDELAALVEAGAPGSVTDR